MFRRVLATSPKRIARVSRALIINNSRLFHTTNNQRTSSNHNNQQFAGFVSQALMNTVKYYWATAFGKILFTFALAFVGWLFNIWANLYYFYSSLTRGRRVAKSFEEVSKREHAEVVESGKYIPRSVVEQELLQLFNIDRKYLLVYGEHGVGKTMLIKNVIKQVRSKGTPVFYFSVDKQQGDSFLESFSVALKGFDVIPVTTSSLDLKLLLKQFLGFGREVPKSVASLFPCIAEAGEILQKKTKKRPVLIIDSCNNLEKQVLIDLQDFAKEQADNKQILVIFVSSEGKAPVTLTTRSAASRMTSYRIGEMSREEADNYLLIKGFKSPTIRSNILDITGYTFQYLLEASEDINMTKQRVSACLEGYLMEVLPAVWTEDEQVVRVVKIILQDGFITYKRYLLIFGTDLGKAKRILAGNIFSIHLGEHTTITFQNVATLNFLKRKLDEETK